jgi:hypothetical protein
MTASQLKPRPWVTIHPSSAGDGAFVVRNDDNMKPLFRGTIVDSERWALQLGYRIRTRDQAALRQAMAAWNLIGLLMAAGR